MAKIGVFKPFRGLYDDIKNTILEDGEIAFERTNKRIYMGDGNHPISSLVPYSNIVKVNQCSNSVSEFFDMPADAIKEFLINNWGVTPWIHLHIVMNGAIGINLDIRSSVTSYSNSIDFLHEYFSITRYLDYSNQKRHVYFNGSSRDIHVYTSNLHDFVDIDVLIPTGYNWVYAKLIGHGYYSANEHYTVSVTYDNNLPTGLTEVQLSNV